MNSTLSMFPTQLLRYALVLLIATPVVAQQSPAELLRIAYELSQSADTYKEYSELIERIQRINLAEAPPEVKKYGESLMAWALNRRGEISWDAMKQPGDANARAATQDFLKSLELDPNRWRAKQNIAFVRAVDGQLEQAEQLLNEVIQAQPRHANAYYNRGELRYEMGQMASAIEDYSRAIELAPKDAEFYSSRGHARFQSGQFPQALNDYQQAFRFDQENATRAVDLADALQHAGQWAAARRHYELATSLEPKNVRAQLNLAWLLATAPSPQVRDAKKAIAITQSLQDVPDNEKFRYIDTHAAALASAGSYPEAIATAQAGLKIASEADRTAFIQRLSKYQSHKPYHQPDRRAN